MSLSDVITTFDFMTGTQKSDVMAYGYTQDVTDAYQQALNYVASGGRVRQIRGGYLIADTLYPQNGIDIEGDGIGNSIIKFTGSAKPCFKVGTSDSALNYGNAIRNLAIYLSIGSGDGIKLNATGHAELQNVFVQGLSTDYNSRTNRAFDLDGRNICGFYNSLINCRTSHCHSGFVSRTTGTTSVTQNTFYNCTTVGDYALGDTTSRGFSFENAGESSTIFGGCVEGCGAGGVYTSGVQGTCFSAFGLRFEANGTDLQHNSTAPEGITILGTFTLDPNKTNDNSGHLNNTIQYGYDGTVNVTGLKVKAGQIVSNGARHRTSSYTGTVYGFSNSPASISIRYSLNDSNVILEFPSFSAASASTAFYIEGAPAEIRPTSGAKQFIVRLVDAGGYAFAAVGSMDTAGTITFSRGLDSGILFTATGTKQLQSCSACYTTV